MLAVAAQTALQAPASTFDYSPASPAAAQIGDYLARKKSPMVGLGESFSNYGRAYNVEPRLIVAIAGAETGFGRHVCADKNSWNWFYRRNCPESPFPTYEAGLERVTRFMRLSYINRGYDSIQLIRSKYCAAGCENWVGLVSRFYGEMPANALPAPIPTVPAAPPRDGLRVFGLPPFLLFFAATFVVAIWASRSLRR